MKRCSKCGQGKPCTEFYRATKRKDGLQDRCKDCTRIGMKEWRGASPENAQRAVDASRWSNRKRLYGVDEKRFNEMIKEQNHKCAICSSAIGISAHVDHCHTSGKVRGLLCSPCNRALGLFRDSLDNVILAAQYLKGHMHDSRSTSSA